MTQLLGYGMLFVLLTVAVYTDIRTRKIANKLIVVGLLLGLLIAVLPKGIGMVSALAGAGVGLLILLPLYVFRAMGAGDVKLMAMSGVFLGPHASVEAALWVLLAGGALALLFAARHGVVRRMLGNVATLFYSAAASVQTRSLPDFSEIPSSAKLPYAVAIAAGVMAFLAARALGFSLI